MSLGARIRDSRRRSGLTQEALAGLVGVRRSVISKYETGAIEPSLAQLRRIAAALGVSPGYLQGSESQDAAALRAAMERGDYPGAEQLMGLPAGALRPLPQYAPPDPGLSALAAAYSALNEAGRQQALERVRELAQLPQYQKAALGGEGDGSVKPGCTEPGGRQEN